jgi:hypothetical protein
MSTPTIEEARATHSQLVYDSLFDEVNGKYDATKWADITPILDGKECDITAMKAAVFTFDLDAWATACAEVDGDGCTFDKTLYTPYAFGFLWQEGDNKCDDYYAPFIMTKPGSALPFEGLYWKTVYGTASIYTGVDYSSETFQFSYADSVICDDFLFLDGCFADLKTENAFHFSFSLLKSTEGLAEGTNLSFHFLWDYD